MIDISETLAAAHNALTQGRRADLEILRTLLARDAIDPMVAQAQRGDAAALAIALEVAIRGL